MAETCITRNTNIDGGILSIEPWSTPRHVFDTTFNSVGDGAVTQQTTLPGKLMIDSGIQTWTNTSPLDARILVRIQRAYRDFHTSNPNYIQIRDRYTYAIGGADPRVPDPSSTYHGATGGAMDLATFPDGTPFAGQLWNYEDPSLLEDWLGPVPPGADFKIWYQCYLWTPPPWSNNANNNSPLHDANVRNTRIQLMAFPTQDTAVVS